MVTLPAPDFVGYLLPSPAEKWAILAYQMTEAYFALPGVREDFERWQAAREAKQNAPTAADCESALPGTEDRASAPERVVGDAMIIAQRGGDFNGGF